MAFVRPRQRQGLELVCLHFVTFLAQSDRGSRSSCAKFLRERQLLLQEGTFDAVLKAADAGEAGQPIRRDEYWSCRKRSRGERSGQCSRLLLPDLRPVRSSSRPVTSYHGQSVCFAIHSQHSIAGRFPVPDIGDRGEMSRQPLGTKSGGRWGSRLKIKRRRGT